jgi:hypothetical protein
MSEEKIKQEVWATIQALNRLWTVENKPEGLNEFFHERMMGISPNYPLRMEDGAECVAGVVKFCETAKIHYFKEIDPKVEVFANGTAAVVVYYFEMAFDVDGKRMEIRGRDMFTLAKENGKWWVIADQFSPFPP